MPWCPNCKIEYGDGCISCDDCGSSLVEKLETLHEKEAAAFGKEEYLISAGNNLEADIIEALLKVNHIPVLRKYREAGSYLAIYMGDSIYGADLYVPSHMLEQALRIVENSRNNSDLDEMADDVFAEELSDEAADDELIDEISDEISEEMTKQLDEVTEQPELTEQLGKTTEQSNELTDQSEEEFHRSAAAMRKKRRIHTWVILLFFVPGVVWGIVVLGIVFYNWLTRQ